ncbi:MAG: hypothetical protein F6K30_03815 [Cyanothece sp. SIO2G6]|nr:hypothetical protein [Cyanothece sp. SIO2G6]
MSVISDGVIPVVMFRERPTYASRCRWTRRKQGKPILVPSTELFAPHAPEQNPVEDIWLEGKKIIRENFDICDTFSKVKELFVSSINFNIFDFSKINEYGKFSNGTMINSM